MVSEHALAVNFPIAINRIKIKSQNVFRIAYAQEKKLNSVRLSRNKRKHLDSFKSSIPIILT